MKTIIGSILTSFCLLTLAAQAEFTVEVNINGSWQEVEDGDLDPDTSGVIFGPVATGTVVERDFRFVNTTANTVIVSDAGFSGPGFEVGLLNTKINPGESEAFAVQYAAATAAVDPILTILNDSGGTTATYTFRVQGLVTPPPPPSYTISGSDARFGTFLRINLGDDSPRASDGTLVRAFATSYFKLINTGDESIRFTSQSFSGPQASEFSASDFPSLPFTLFAGGERRFEISFSALVSGQNNATFELFSELSPSPFTFAVGGDGAPPPGYTVSGRSGNSFTEITSGDTSPDSADGTLFTEPQRFGSSSSNSFKISNTGSVPITFSSRLFSGPQAAEFFSESTLPFTVAVGEDKTFNLRWLPLGSGQDNATFELTSSLSLSPFTFAVRGTAMGTEIGVRPERSSFIVDQNPASPLIERIGYGLTDLGTTKSRAFEIKNEGFDPLFITSIISDNVKFQVDHSIVELAPGAVEQFTIAFAPTALGHDEALITIESNAPDENETFNFITDGIGENNVGSPEIAVTSTILGDDIAPLEEPLPETGTNFGLVATGNTATREFTISNIGDSPLAITDITLNNPTQFSVSSLNITVPAGGETTFNVTFHPTSVGAHPTFVTIANNDPDVGEYGSESPYQLQLVGDGVVRAPEIVVRVVGRGRIPISSAPSVPLGTLHPTESYREGISDDLDFSLSIENESFSATALLIHQVRRGPFRDNYEFPLSVGSQQGPFPLTVRPFLIDGPGTYRSTITVISNAGDDGIYTFEVQVTLTGDGARILSITKNGANIDLGIDLSEAGSYFIDESEDLSTWTLMNPPSFSGQQGVQTKTLPGRATPPASGQRFFRLRLEE